LALFGRRPPQRVEGFVMPASKNLHNKRLMHRSKRQLLFNHELLRRCDDSKSSIAPILNGPKNSGLHGNVLDRRRITEQSDLRRHR
jgi:hypothetical protein